jgi:PST family polysaccharide transporter
MQRLHKLLQFPFFKQYSWLTVLYGFQLLIPYIILPYLLSTIGEAGYGQIAFSLSIVAYFIALIDYGFHIFGSRQIALLESNSIKQKTFFINVIYTKGCLFVIGAIILISFILFLPRVQDVQEILFIFLILALSYVFNPQFFMTGKQKIKVLALVTMGIKMLYVLLVFIIVKEMNDLWLYALIYSVMMVVISVINFVYVLINYKMSRVKFHLKIILTLIKDAFPLFSTSLMNQIFLVFGTFYLGFIVSDSHVGIYASLLKVSSVIVILYLPLSDAFLPYITNVFQADLKKGMRYHKTYALVVMSLIAFFATLIFVFRPWIFKVLLSFDTSEYAIFFGMMLVIQMLGVMINISSVQGLIALGEEHLYQKIYLMLTFLFITLTVSLGQMNDILGILAAHLMTFIIGALIFEIMYIKSYQKRLEALR